MTAQDERARAIERDLHDGAQQQLVALSVKLRLVDALVEREPAKARALVSELQADSADALENLRDLARGSALPEKRRPISVPGRIPGEWSQITPGELWGRLAGGRIGQRRGNVPARATIAHPGRACLIREVRCICRALASMSRRTPFSRA